MVAGSAAARRVADAAAAATKDRRSQEFAQLAVGEGLDVELLHEGFGLGTGPEGEVGPALLPDAGDGADFGVVLGEVDDQLGGAGLEAAEEVAVGVAARFDRAAGHAGDEAVEEDVAGALFSGEHLGGDGVLAELFGGFGGGAREHADDLGLLRNLRIDLEVIGAREEGPHVAVDVGELDAELAGAVDLGAELGFDLGGGGMGCDGADVAVEIAIGVEETFDFGGVGDGAPAVVAPFAGESEVEAEVEAGVLFGEVGELGEPGAGDHDAGGLDRGGEEGLGGGEVDGVAHAGVVGVDHQELGAGASEALGSGFRAGLGEGSGGDRCQPRCGGSCGDYSGLRLDREAQRSDAEGND